MCAALPLGDGVQTPQGGETTAALGKGARDGLVALLDAALGTR